MKVKEFLLIKVKLIHCLSLFIVVSFFYNVNAQTVSTWLTVGDKSILFKEQPKIDFSKISGSNSSVISINKAMSYQSIDGFGYCLTEGSAEVLAGLDSIPQNNLLRTFFDTVTGIGVSVLRISIGASDLSSSNYSYNDVSSDANLVHFSLSGPDSVYLIPVLKKILAINSSIKILATPWSAPKWMKTNKAWIGGSLDPACYAVYASYFVKYLNAMKSLGVEVWAITPQNEPKNPNNEPSMVMTSTEQTKFINNNLGPAIRNAGYSTKILAYDHNCDDTDYPTSVCKNSEYVDGAAFHLYAGNISALSTIHYATGKNVYLTEQYTASSGSFSGDLSWHLENVMIGSILNWSKAAIEWNFAANASFGPRTPSGCSICLGAATVNSSASYDLNVSYYIVAHLSKIVKPGAVRISSVSTNADLKNIAFKNPDGSYALVVHNKGANSAVFSVKFGSAYFSYTLKPASVASFVWKDNPVTAFIGDFFGKQNDIVLSPNPSSNFFNVSLKNQSTFTECIVFDLMGKVVIRKILKGSANSTIINTGELSTGAYILQLKGNNIFSYTKFVKN